jgi:hypothetical protein
VRVTYRFPNLDIWEEIQDWFPLQELQLNEKVYIKNQKKCNDIDKWAHLVCEVPPKVEVRTFKDYLNDSIECWLSMELPENEAMMFKLTFGEGHHE